MSWVNDFRNPSYCSAVFDVLLPNGDTEGFVMAPFEYVRAFDVLHSLPVLRELHDARLLHRRCVSSVFLRWVFETEFYS